MPSDIEMEAEVAAASAALDKIVIRHRCFACFAKGLDVSEHSCEIKTGCKGSIWLCSECKTLRDSTPCPFCWVADLSRCCFGCGGPLVLSR